jgi:hypothetical protein
MNDARYFALVLDGGVVGWVKDELVGGVEGEVAARVVTLHSADNGDEAA